MALDRVCKLFDLFWFEIRTRLVGIGMNLREQDLAPPCLFHRFSQISRQEPQEPI